MTFSRTGNSFIRTRAITACIISKTIHVQRRHEIGSSGWLL